MTKSSRRKDKLRGRPEWVASNEKCEECGSALVKIGVTGYICSECGLIQERLKKRVHKKTIAKRSAFPQKPPDQNDNICPDCKKEFSTDTVQELHFQYSGHGSWVYDKTGDESDGRVQEGVHDIDILFPWYTEDVLYALVFQATYQ